VSELLIGTRGRSNCRDLGAKDINPYVAEHVALIKSIRGEGAHVNHAMAVAESTLSCIMARESAYSGEAVSWDEMLESKQDWVPKEFSLETKLAPVALAVPGIYKRV
jgi:hypothetical protein